MFQLMEERLGHALAFLLKGTKGCLIKMNLQEQESHLTYITTSYK